MADLSTDPELLNIIKLNPRMPRSSFDGKNTQSWRDPQSASTSSEIIIMRWTE
jgi:hypothetical protein